ncbi:MAG: MFS transporter [Sporichthyaceae bacterium]
MSGPTRGRHARRSLPDAELVPVLGARDTAVVTSDPAGQPLARRAPDGVIVLMMCLLVGLVFAAGTVLFTALPTVAQDLRASQTSALWLADIYPLVIAALLMPAGALIDRWGRKRGCLIGLVLIGVTFPLAGLAQSPGPAIALLGVAGVGGALAFPATLATITAIMAKERRGTAVGMWSASMLGGGAVGAAGGGALTETVDPFWVFAAPGIVAALLFLPTLALVPESRDDRHARFDLVGAVLSALGVGLFVLGMIEAPSKGWTHPLTLSALLGLAFLVLFVRWELRTPEPLLDVRLLLQPRFGMGSFVNVMSWFMAYGSFFLGVQYRVFTLDYGPLLAGVSLVSMMGAVPMGAVGPRLAHRYGARIVMAGGLAMMSVGSVAMAFATTTETYHWVALAEIATFGGLGLIGGPATEAIVDGLPASHQGVASAVNDTTRELGVAVGVAMMGSLFNLAYRDEIAGNPFGVPPAILEATRESAAAGVQLAATLPVEIATAQLDHVQSAVASGYAFALAVAAAVMAVAALVVWRVHPADRPIRSTVREPATTSPVSLAQLLVEVRDLRDRVAWLEAQLALLQVDDDDQTGPLPARHVFGAS